MDDAFVMGKKRRGAEKTAMVLTTLLAGFSLSKDAQGKNTKNTYSPQDTVAQERPYSLRFGFGDRSVDVTKILGAYALEQPDLNMGDVIKAGKKSVPYFMIEGVWQQEALELTLGIQGTGLYFLPKQEGKGEVIDIFRDCEKIADASSYWTESLNGYYKVTAGIFDVRRLVQSRKFGLERVFGLGAGFGMVNNYTTLSMVLNENDLVDALGGREAIEEDYGIPTESYTTVAIQGWTAALDPMVGLTATFGRTELRLQGGYFWEQAHVHSKERALLGIDQNDEKVYDLDVAAPLSGLHAELLVGFQFGNKND